MPPLCPLARVAPEAEPPKQAGEEEKAHAPEEHDPEAGEEGDLLPGEEGGGEVDEVGEGGEEGEAFQGFGEDLEGAMVPERKR